MKPAILSHDAYLRAVTLRDLTDPAQGSHAIQQLIDRILTALRTRWECEVIVHRAHPAVPVEHNYDRLHYPHGGAARDARYSRYVSETTVLRTQTSAMIPPLLASIAHHSPGDVLLACPGLVYRRDEIDRLHTGEPHQMDLWRVVRGRVGIPELREMVAVAMAAVFPGREYRLNAADHPYTTDGVEIEARADGGGWVEVGECGLALPAILDEAGLPAPDYSGLAMGLGLDRLLMLVKGMDDIRVLRSEDPRICAQMLDLEPYRAVSGQPAIRRDLSIAVAADRTPEELGDRVRQALGDRAEAVESIEVLSETPYDEVPRQARERIGMAAGQKNVLVRLVIRDLVRTLTSAQANAVRDAVYASLHEGTAWQWASAA
ncbi:MAG TPA: hypothetical protein VHG93_17900 [Longimicrobium sp.]|nr:hypothetical protein [Longimicrobium sp.]